MTNYLFSGKRLKEYKLRTMRKTILEKNACEKGFFEGIVIDQKANEKSSSVSNVVEDIICLSVYRLP